MNEEERALKEHVKLGFKMLSEQEQVELLLTGNADLINRFTPGYRSPTVFPSLYKLYITISKDVFRKYFHLESYLQRKNLSHNLMPDSDGDWIEPQKDGTFKHYFQERGRLSYVDTIINREQLITGLINEIYSYRGLK